MALSELPARPPLRLQLLLPAAPLPAWLGPCAQALAGVPGLALVTAGAVDGPAPDIVLALDGHVPAQPVSAVSWMVADAAGQALCPHWPLLRALTAGGGIQLALLQRQPGAVDWTVPRRLHVAAPAHYGQALAALPAALQRLLAQALTDHAQVPPGAAAQPAPLPQPAGPPPPGWRRLAWRLAGSGRAWAARQRARWLSEHWRIGIINAPIHTLLQARPAGLPAVRWITPEQAQGYWADPFGVPNDARQLCCEYFDERSGVGHLQTLQLDAQDRITGHTRLAVGAAGAAGAQQHASFPNVFELDGRRLGLAETVAAGECVLHAVGDDGSWQPLHTLLAGVGAADPALFQWQGRHWLAYTDISLGTQDNLCLQHAPGLQGPWQPHANNPVRVDLAGARMAGRFFVHDGVLYRPGQDCLATYGAAVVIYRVLRLTPDAYDEVAVRRLAPDAAGPCPHGLHTLTAWGQRTLIDGKRMGINRVALRRKLGRWRPPLLRGRAPTPTPMPAPAGRVCVYVPHLRLGGGETSLLRLAAGFAASGLAVDLVVHTLATRELQAPAGVQLLSLDCRGTAAALPRLVRLLRQRRPRWLLSAFPHTNLAAVVAATLARSGTCCIVSEHAPLSQQIGQQAATPGGWRYRLLPPAVRWAYRRAAAVVAVSDGVRTDLQALLGPATTLHVIANPVLPPTLDAELAQTPDHPWLGDPALQVVLCVCRLSPEKDLPLLIRAFAALHRQRPATRLLLAGDGPERAALQSQIDSLGLAAVAQLPGRTAQPLRWMHHAAVFALASRYEGFGNVLVEAMACGTPVVSTDCPVGPREILQGGALGALVPVGDAQAMAQALAAALDGGGPPAQARQAALRYTHAAATAAYLQLLHRLAAPAC